jgi:hypothetical protein
MASTPFVTLIVLNQSCPTSNCTWPPYDTLAVCSQCADISEYLTFACIDGRVDWTSNLTGGGFGIEDTYPNATMCGYFLNFTMETPIMMSGYIVDSENDSSIMSEALLMRTVPMVSVFDKTPLFGNGSIKFDHIRNPISDFLIVSAANGTAASVYDAQLPVAQECILSYCVQTIHSSYDWGTYHEKIEKVHYNTTIGPYPWQTREIWTGFQNATDIYYAENFNIDVGPTTFGTSNDTAYATMMLFDDFFPSTYTSKPNDSKPLLRYKTWLTGPAYNRVLDYNPWLAPHNVSQHMERLATAVTNVMRSDTSKEMVQGEAYSMENYVAVRWEWITLPLGLLFMSLIFLAATVFKSAHEREQVGILKNSAILTLLHGIPDDMRGKLTRTSSTGTPRAKAKELKVRLHPNGGWRISGHIFSPLTSRVPKAQPPPGWI